MIGEKYLLSLDHSYCLVTALFAACAIFLTFLVIPWLDRRVIKGLRLELPRDRDDIFNRIRAKMSREKGLTPREKRAYHHGLTRDRGTEDPVRNFVPYVKLYIMLGLGDVQISALDSLEIQGFYNELVEGRLLAETVRNIHGVLNNALKQAVKWGLIGRNPAAADLVDLPKYR